MTTGSRLLKTMDETRRCRCLESLLICRDVAVGYNMITGKKLHGCRLSKIEAGCMIDVEHGPFVFSSGLAGFGMIILMHLLLVPQFAVLRRAWISGRPSALPLCSAVAVDAGEKRRLDASRISLLEAVRLSSALCLAILSKGEAMVAGRARRL